MYTGLRVIFAGAYTVVYTFLALMASGGGHGSVIVTIPLLTWVFFFIAIVVFDKFGRGLFYILMALHYSFVFLIMRGLSVSGFDPNEVKYWNRYPGVILLTAGVYLTGQIVAWVWFYKWGRIEAD